MSIDKNLKSFILAWLAIIAAGATIVFAMQVAVRLSPETKKPPRRQSSKQKLPSDIPLYEGARLAKTVKSTSDSYERTMFRYIVPLASVPSVESFYTNEMKARDWQIFTQTNRCLEFYKENGQRQVKVSFHTEAGPVVLTIEVFKKPR